MPKCIFCDNELTISTKPEHILLDALGGRKTTTRVDCSTCNSTFGGSIDNILADQVKQIRNLMQFKSGSGDLAPQLKNIQAGEKRINIKGDGEMKFVERPFIIEEIEDRKWNIQIKASSIEEIEYYIPHMAAKMKMPEERLREQIAASAGSRMSERPGIVHFTPQFGGADAIRSMVKSALVLWSLVVGNQEVKGEPYSDTRDFVLKGGDAFLKQRVEMDSRYKEMEAAIKAKYGPLYNLIFIKSNLQGKVIAHFTLYNINTWQIILAERGGTPNKCAALISNPEDPSNWSDRAGEEFNISFNWLSSPEYLTDFKRQKDRLDVLMKRYFEVNNPKAYAELVEHSLIQIGLKPGDAIPAERAEELSRIVSGRMAHHMTNVPYEEKLSPEQMASLFGKT